VEDAFERSLWELSSSATAAPSNNDSPAVPVAGPGETITTERIDPGQRKGIDKNVLAVPTPRRYRNREHLRYVAQQPCLVCGRRPSDPHHLRFAQPRALGRKVSDEFAVPLCRIHHRLVHRVGNEEAWWQEVGIDPIKAAGKLWKRTRLEQPKPNSVKGPISSNEGEAPGTIPEPKDVANPPSVI